MTKSQLKC